MFLLFSSSSLSIRNKEYHTPAKIHKKSGDRRPRENLRPSVAQAEPFDEGSVAVEILLAKIPKKFSSGSHHLEEPSPGVEVLRMHLEMLRKITDALGQHGNLNFRRTRIDGMGAVIGDYSLLLFFFEHFPSPRK